jgi:hypothetical protein
VGGGEPAMLLRPGPDPDAVVAALAGAGVAVVRPSEGCTLGRPPHQPQEHA